jgi:hypothetical protein
MPRKRGRLGISDSNLGSLQRAAVLKKELRWAQSAWFGRMFI